MAASPIKSTQTIKEVKPPKTEGWYFCELTWWKDPKLKTKLRIYHDNDDGWKADKFNKLNRNWNVTGWDPE